MKIICIGRNYAAHAKELQNKVEETPVIFLKPETALLNGRLPFFIPDFSDDIHYECELVVRISRLGKNIAEKFAHRYYDAISLGIDFTARDLQSQLKTKGLPWERAKAFDGSAPAGRFISKEQFENIQNLNFKLKLNNELRQNGNTSDMLFSVDQIIAFASTYFTLKKGDLIFTGTPEGVGPVKAGDHLEAELEGEQVLSVKIR